MLPLDFRESKILTDEMTLRLLSATFLLLFTTQSIYGQEKKPLDHDVYEIWNRITDTEISSNGNWVLYAMSPEDQDGVLTITNVTDNREYSVPQGDDAVFTYGSEAAVFLVSPPKDSVRQAKLDKKKKDEMPGDSLGVINLVNGNFYGAADVLSYKVPEKNGDWVAYMTRLSDDDSEDADTTSPESEAKEEGEADKAKEDDDKKREDGKPLHVYSIATESVTSFALVSDYEFSEDGQRLAFTTVSKSGDSDGIYLLSTATGRVDTLASGQGDYKNVSFDDSGSQVAFLSNVETFSDDQPSFSVYYYTVGESSAAAVATEGDSFLGEGWWISEHGNVHFSEDGSRLFFGTAPKPEPESDDSDILEDEKVVVEVWSWTDDDFYPAQKIRLESEKKRSYLAVYHVNNDRSVQLASEDFPTVSLLDDGNGKYGIANSNMSYRKERSWDFPAFYDSYLVNLADGSRTPVVEGIQSQPRLSPEGKYVIWWDHSTLSWMSQPVDGSGSAINLTESLPYPVFNEIHDWPYPANSYGLSGWTDGDRRLLVNDKHDIWSVDPTGRRDPVSITANRGRSENLRFRYVRLDPEQDAIDPESTALLSAFNYGTKESGFYNLTPADPGSLTELVMEKARFSTPVQSRQGDRLMWTRESFTEFPDVRVSDKMFDGQDRVSTANPQQSEYLWGSAELVSWSTLDGIPVDGILYKPENFDPSQQYPMMVYFYEKSSDGLYRHDAPAPHRSVINKTFYTSRGYLVFVPDIPYKIGYPGESAMNAIMPGVTMLIGEGFVDEDNIGVQGHSWGGYQIAYMVTKTNLFKAAEAGAPVSNMISAYGGVRWGSGLSRMFQYERTQSRIGGSLWEYPMRYISNSPIFEADKIETPLLIMHNDEDGAVPWYQGIELFAALRRLDKPVWLINYNGEPHWPTTYPNKRDWAIRMQQYFDHFLKGEPAAEWITNGVPEVRKGTTLGLEQPTPASQ